MTNQIQKTFFTQPSSPYETCTSENNRISKLHKALLNGAVIERTKPFDLSSNQLLNAYNERSGDTTARLWHHRRNAVTSQSNRSRYRRWGDVFALGCACCGVLRKRPAINNASAGNTSLWSNMQEGTEQTFRVAGLICSIWLITRAIAKRALKQTKSWTLFWVCSSLIKACCTVTAQTVVFFLCAFAALTA